jgi:hypothetical protein
MADEFTALQKSAFLKIMFEVQNKTTKRRVAMKNFNTALTSVALNSWKRKNPIIESFYEIATGTGR